MRLIVCVDLLAIAPKNLGISAFTLPVSVGNLGLPDYRRQGRGTISVSTEIEKRMYKEEFHVRNHAYSSYSFGPSGPQSGFPNS